MQFLRILSTIIIWENKNTINVFKIKKSLKIIGKCEIIRIIVFEKYDNIIFLLIS